MQDVSVADVVCDGNVHVMPDDDHIIHIELSTCMCGPSLELIPADPARGIKDTILFYTHNALTGETLD
jgi:hypothetical protein